jgi:cell division protease FtsH
MRVHWQAIRNRVAHQPRHRLLLAAGLTTLLLVVGTALLLAEAARPPAAGLPPAGQLAGRWTLADLNSHLAAGEVTLIDLAAGEGGSRVMIARTGAATYGVGLTIPAAEAARTLANLGYGDLLSSRLRATVGEASAAAGDPLRNVVTIGFLVVLGIVAVTLVAQARGGSLLGRRSARFATIMPSAHATAVAASAANIPVAIGAGVQLADVAGCEEAKLELAEAIEFLRDPANFRSLGARVPRGILLYGPPGTGKTMLARAVATEASVPFHHASGADFVEKYVGVGARRVRDLFAQARKLGKGVIFIDEFDALGKARGGSNSHEEREQTLNALLVELDGFDSAQDLVVIGATNRVDILDEAVLRPGRFSRKVHVGLPDVAGRKAILEVHARGKPLGDDVSLESLARKTYGFSGAQLADLLNEGAILAARRRAVEIGAEDIHGGWLKVAVGTGRRRSMNERERAIIAAHEVGHAICGRVHGDNRHVEEISLFAHGDALGVTVSSQEDNDLPAESDLRARLVALMGGRAAEELLFDEVTPGAASDFEKATQLATMMVSRWGMGRDPQQKEEGPSGRGNLSFFAARRDGSLPTELQAAATRAAAGILDEAYRTARQTLVEHIALLRRIGVYLVRNERIDGDTFDALFDGQLDVPDADTEWRPAAARPRDWSSIGAPAAAAPAEVAATDTMPFIA